MLENLRHTLLFASALQLFGAEHQLTRRLEENLKRRKQSTVDDAITRLPSDMREKLLARYKELACQLPREVRGT